MFNSKIPSPARSLGGKTTPRRHKRRTYSVCSPARSENSVKLTALLPDNFVVSPLPKRRSVLTDDTDIEMPRRQSWWMKLNENSRDVMELLEHRDAPEGNMMIEENFDVEILSQEKKNYTVDLPESSDCESINSIVIPQRKLFTHKENNPPKKFTHVMNNREELAKLQKSHVDHVNEIDVRPKSLFNQAKKTKPKPIFPPALLNMSTNKSIANKTELPVVESKGPARNLFGNRPGTKRKNMFADFIVSESEDEIPEIQPKVFGFQNKYEVKQRMSHAAHGLSNSPTTSIIDIDMDDWKHLPSSTMVENQIEEQEATPSKRKRLSKLLESKNMENGSVNKTKNKSKLTNESIKPTNRSKQFLSPTTNNQVVNTSKKQGTDETIVQPNQSRNNANSTKIMKTFMVEAHTAKLQENDINDKEKSNHDEIEKDDEHVISDNNKINDIQDKQETFSKSPHESEAEDDFTLEYENEEDNVVHNEKSFRNNLDDVPNEVLEEAHKTLVSKEISQGENKEEINVTETMKPKNDEPEEDDRNDKTTKNKSYEISKNIEGQNDENDFNNDDSKQAKHVSKSTVSQEIQDEESGDENDEGEENDNECEKNDDEPEENDDEESENEKVEEMSVSEDEENENLHEIINKDSTNEEKINKELDHQNQIDVADDNEQIEYRKSDMSNKEININISTKITHTTSCTTENKKSNVTNEDPPEAILFQETNNLIESFTLKEHNSPRKTKSMIRHSLKPSLAPVRESTGFSDNTGNSSANSGWDSHRTTRKTLRKTFGKDFTPRKSLRTLVMEKAAKYQSFNPDIRNTDQHPNSDFTELVTHEGKSVKRQTSNPDLRDISKHPNANSTELIAHEVTSAKRHTFNPDLHDISNHPNANSTEFIAHEVKSAKRQTFNPNLHDISKHPNANSTELLAQEQRSTNRQTFNPDLHDISKHSHANFTELPTCDGNEPLEQSDVDTVEKIQTDIDESEHDDNESTHEAGSDEEENQQMEDDNQVHNETTGQSEVESVEENSKEIDDKDDNNETTDHTEDESVEENPEEIDDDNDDDNNETTEHTKAKSVEEMEDDDNNETTQHTEAESMEENPEEIEDDVVNNDTTQQTEAESAEENPEEIEDDVDNNDTTQHTEAESAEENPEEIEDDVDNNDTTKRTEAEDEDNQEEIEESDENVNEISQHSMNDSSDHAEMEESDDDVNENTEQSEREIIETNDIETEETVEESDHELLKRMRYLQKIRQERFDIEKKVRENITNSLKKCANRDPFKLPYMMPMHQASKPVRKAKPKVWKTTPLYVVPEEILEDMKYKPPKRFQPRNASWATKRLYKYLESKLEPKYSYMCRVRAEKLVGTIYEFTRQVRRHELAPPAAVDALKLEMARLKVVDTHYEFYHFFHEYMPREIRVKVNPDAVNKIQMPKDVFANIIR